MGMWSLGKPSADALARFLAAQRELPFTYGAVGATAGTPPAGYVVDRTRIKLGEGEPVFHAAKAALQRWEQFNLGWVEAWSPDTPIKSGEVVSVCKTSFVRSESFTGPVTQTSYWRAWANTIERLSTKCDGEVF